MRSKSLRCFNCELFQATVGLKTVIRSFLHSSYFKRAALSYMLKLGIVFFFDFEQCNEKNCGRSSLIYLLMLAMLILIYGSMLSDNIWKDLLVKLAGGLLKSEIELAGRVIWWILENSWWFFYTLIKFAKKTNKKRLFRNSLPFFQVENLFCRWKLPLNFRTLPVKLCFQKFCVRRSGLAVKLAGVLRKFASETRRWFLKLEIRFSSEPYRCVFAFSKIAGEFFLIRDQIRRGNSPMSYCNSLVNFFKRRSTLPVIFRKNCRWKRQLFVF